MLSSSKSSSSFLRSQKFHDFQNDWLQFIQNSKTIDWNDLVEDPSPAIADEQWWHVASKKTKKNKPSPVVAAAAGTRENMVQGKIVYWNDKKHYGFIYCYKFPEDNVFFHGTNFVHGTPARGMYVDFEIQKDGGKTYTTRVTLTKRSAKHPGTRRPKAPTFVL